MAHIAAARKTQYRHRSIKMRCRFLKGRKKINHVHAFLPQNTNECCPAQIVHLLTFASSDYASEPLLVLFDNQQT